MKAAVTGGTGFVGAALIELLLNEGWDVAALARNPARLPAADKVRVVRGALEDEKRWPISPPAPMFFFTSPGSPTPETGRSISGSM